MSPICEYEARWFSRNDLEDLQKPSFQKQNPEFMKPHWGPKNSSIPKIEAHLLILELRLTILSRNSSVNPLMVMSGAKAMKTLILSLICFVSSDKAENMAAELSEYPKKATLSYPV